ncbi:MAG TPA: bifunctional sulfate adenylyltransferase/adenylylsulfate kinase [Candidatus Dormibacteraeota bacterium]
MTAVAAALAHQLVRPHGGVLVDLMADPGRAAELRVESAGWVSWDLTPRQLCDLELLLGGGFSPLRGFLGRHDYESVVSRMRLTDGTLWPIPVTLDVPADVASKLGLGASLALRDPEGVMLAALHVKDMWQPDLAAEARAVFGTLDPAHPGVDHLLTATHPWYVSGSLEGLHLPTHHDYRDLRRTPAQLRSEFTRLGWRKVVAFQTRNPLHRAHLELTLRAAKDVGANLLVHPVVGMTKPGDVDHYTRVRCYQAVMPAYPEGLAMLSLLPLAMRMGGPREALWHAIIRKNYGAGHLIVGRDHAGPGADGSGKPFYGPYDAQQLIRRHEAELGVAMVPFSQMVYLEDRDEYLPDTEVPDGARVLSISGTDMRRRLDEGEELPGWFTPPEVAAELRRSYPSRCKQGFVVLFTGLSGSGKSTIANVLLVKLLELGGRPVTLLDGDIVRKHLSSELGFSKEHRDLNIRRIGFVASEISKNGGIALCAPIAPYAAARREVRKMIKAGGGFVLVHVSTPLAVCEARDRKGLYAKARAGILKEFTGISDPYEVPDDAEIVVDTSGLTAAEAAQKVISWLEREGYLGPVG